MQLKQKCVVNVLESLTVLIQEDYQWPLQWKTNLKLDTKSYHYFNSL